MLPRLNMQLNIGDWRRGHHRMAPHRPHPLHVRAILRLAQSLQVVDNILAPHLPKRPEQITRVVQHNSRILALCNQLRYPLAHSLIAPGKYRGIVIIALSLMLKHILKVAN